MPPNCKAVGPTEAELHILKVQKLDACIRPLFANSVTINVWLYFITFSYFSFQLFFHCVCKHPIIPELFLPNL